MAEVEKIFLRAAVLDGVLFIDEAYSLALVASSSIRILEEQSFSSLSRETPG